MLYSYSLIFSSGTLITFSQGDPAKINSKKFLQFDSPTMLYAH